MRSLETWLQWIAHGSISRKTEYGIALPLPGRPEMDVEMKLVPSTFSSQLCNCYNETMDGMIDEGCFLYFGQYGK